MRVRGGACSEWCERCPEFTDFQWSIHPGRLRKRNFSSMFAVAVSVISKIAQMRRIPILIFVVCDVAVVQRERSLMVDW